MACLDEVIVGIVVMSEKCSSECKGNEAVLLLEKEMDKMVAEILKGKKKK